MNAASIAPPPEGAVDIPDPVSAPAAAVSLLPSPADELARIRREMPRLLMDLGRRMLLGGPPFPLLHFGEPHKVVRLSREVAGDAEDWFFIGDLHGDFFALHTLLRHAEASRPGCKVLFLGDMVDRGDHPFECVFLLLEWGLRHPGRLAWIAGNHDVAFDLPEGAAHFTSIVSPAELLDVLNRDDAMHGFRRQLGRFFVELGRRLPRALLFPDGLLATHGGMPLVDLQAQASAIADEAAYMDWLNSPACLKDFTWTRISRVPKRIPDRYSTGAQYGFKDFEAFCALRPEWFPVQRMITGHEHPADGFAVHATYKVNPALTLVGFGFDDLKPFPAAYQHYTETLHIAQGQTGALPVVLSVPVDREELNWMYPAEPATIPGAKAAEPSAGASEAVGSAVEEA
jgi:hypothetical protein